MGGFSLCTFLTAIYPTLKKKILATMIALVLNDASSMVCLDIMIKVFVTKLFWHFQAGFCNS